MSPVGAKGTGWRLGIASLLALALAAAAAPEANAAKCFGKPATLTGTDGDDNITGTSGNDVIVAKGGNDDIDGGGGDDRICGGRGGDKIDPGDGRDQVRGGGGPDEIDSADGEADTVNAGSGKDTCKTDSSDTVKSCKTQAFTPECLNGIDDDLDGRVDYPADRGCQSADDDSENSDRH